MSKQRARIAFDVECYPNYFLIQFKREDGKVVSFELRGDQSFSEDEIKRIDKIFKAREMIGFNSTNYDLPMIQAAMAGFTNKQLKKLSDKIIRQQGPTWMITSKMDLAELRGFQHIDLINVAPGVAVSLKLYGARMHTLKLQDLPYEPSLELNEEQMDAVRAYCGNDIDVTFELLRTIQHEVDIRYALTESYGFDCLSLGGAQIAEKVMRHELKNLRIETGRNEAPETFRYEMPDYIHFKDPSLIELYGLIQNIEFGLSEKGYPLLPKELSSFKLMLGKTKYKIGLGGLHSQEKKTTWLADEEVRITDADVTSYYPSIIINDELYPGDTPQTLKIYEKIFKERLKAKAKYNKLKSKIKQKIKDLEKEAQHYKNTSESLKLCVNSFFGKFGSQWSHFYDPQLMVQVTITGQLALLMLIERLEGVGISVISANTDGVVSVYSRELEDLYSSVCKAWEEDTAYDLEYNEYKSYHARDVNNYIAITTDNKPKVKGIMVESHIVKNPAASIVPKAVKLYLTEDQPIEETINSATLQELVVARRVTGGATYKGEEIGKIVRWVNVKEGGENILYKKNGNRVPCTDKAFPVMDYDKVKLEDLDIDYQWYIDEAKSTLKDLGL